MNFKKIALALLTEIGLAPKITQFGIVLLIFLPLIFYNVNPPEWSKTTATFEEVVESLHVEETFLAARYKYTVDHRTFSIHMRLPSEDSTVLKAKVKSLQEDPLIDIWYKIERPQVSKFKIKMGRGDDRIFKGLLWFIAAISLFAFIIQDRSKKRRIKRKKTKRPMIGHQ